MARKSGSKGILLEETLRAYFVRAGLFAVRGIPLVVDGEELSDIDIWLYETPTGSSRRRLILDAKSKTRPKAIERLFWTKGVRELLQVDGAYIATTDTRPILRRLARSLEISILDGTDLKRMMESTKVLFPDRLHEEEIESLIRSVDEVRGNKLLQNNYRDLKAGLIDEFGSGTINRSLESFAFFSDNFIKSHPKSEAASVCLRLAYVAASLAAIALDFVLTNVSFRSQKERQVTVANVIRYGFEDQESGLEKIRIATALVEKYATNGRTIAQNLDQAVRRDLERIPAEDVADYVVNRLRNRGAFEIARSLDRRAFNKTLVGYDALSPEEKSFIGVLVDFCGLGREYFALGWTGGDDSGEERSEEQEPSGENLWQLDLTKTAIGLNKDCAPE